MTGYKQGWVPPLERHEDLKRPCRRLLFTGLTGKWPPEPRISIQASPEESPGLGEGCLLPTMRAGTVRNSFTAHPCRPLPAEGAGRCIFWPVRDCPWGGPCTCWQTNVAPSSADSVLNRSPSKAMQHLLAHYITTGFLTILTIFNNFFLNVGSSVLKSMSWSHED